MTTFTSLVSKFAHANGESSTDNSSQNGNAGSNHIANDKKRAYHSSNSGIQAEDSEEVLTAELATQVRKSLRLSSTSTSQPLSSRTVRADSVRTRPHHKREARTVNAVKKEDIKKEEETPVVRPKTQSRNAGYAPPEVYAHLSNVPDIIDYDLDVLFVGINPGVKSSERSHHFAGPTNHFWPCLCDSGPTDDRSLPAIANMGLTNLVDRPSRMGNELSAAECRAAAPILTAKIKKYRPRFVCFVSKQAWEMYTGVGLGLQTAWVSWYDEPEDEDLADIKHDDRDLDDLGNRDYLIQSNLDAQGYRLAPYFKRGPSIDELEGKLEEEGAHSSLKREAMGIDGNRVKSEEDEHMDMSTNAEFAEVKPLKTEIDETNDVKKEGQYEDKKVKMDHSVGDGSSLESGDRGRGGRVRGSRMFVMPSTSGRVTQYRKEDKLAYFKQLAELVHKDRQLRGMKAL
ncbi:hypothetical protein BGZ99_002932 [Dissophora globulifera]|uniref:Uracil-DNA glycosylase-like domain-containing protein n=1 Tax=Dissophora globulifera TaxID=979702 RepID=A0A9P6UWT2_9FUNG|nr:hypothetical protein BGZ99_002932 [Dissophora globulifera]